MNRTRLYTLAACAYSGASIAIGVHEGRAAHAEWLALPETSKLRFCPRRPRAPSDGAFLYGLCAGIVYATAWPITYAIRGGAEALRRAGAYGDN